MWRRPAWPPPCSRSFSASGAGWARRAETPATRTARSGRASRAPEGSRPRVGHAVQCRLRSAVYVLAAPRAAFPRPSAVASGGWRVARCRDYDLTAGLRGRPGSCSLPVISRPQLALCSQPRVLANLRNAEEAGGASGQAAGLSGFLETKIGAVQLSS